MNERLGSGVSIGNALEAAPNEGAWGVVIDDAWFERIDRAGFDAVRLPVRWSAHALGSAPYTIDPDFADRVDEVVDGALRRGLQVVVNVHHYHELTGDPDAHEERFLALWRQIAERHADRPAGLAFELLNEPRGALDARRWNALAARALDIVRETNPERTVLIGPSPYNRIDALDTLVLPDDPNLIASVHYYEPFRFTHQGAHWTTPPVPLGATWSATDVVLDASWTDVSWSTSATAESDGSLRLDFERRHAGFALEREEPFAPRRLAFRVRGPLAALVKCRGVGGETVQVGRVRAERGGQAITVDLGACPEDTRRLLLVNVAPGTSSARLRNLEVCDADGCADVLMSGGQAIDDALSHAAAWSETRGVPMNLGEFGTFGAGGTVDADPRAAWTAYVHRSARTRGLSTMYWEFAAELATGKGAHDELLDALGAD